MPVGRIATEMGPGCHAAQDHQADEVLGVDFSQTATTQIKKKIVELRPNQGHRQADVFGNRARRLAGGITPEEIAGEEKQKSAG